MRNIRLDICYDGTRYRGWQRLANQENTIQEKLERTLSRILGETIEISGSGRTDAGTHAMGQVANFHCNSTMPSEEILAELRKYLPEDIGIYSCKNVSPRFHARLNAKTKTYRYRVWFGKDPCVFDRKYTWYCFDRLDVGLMKKAAAMMVGEHDFKGFSSVKKTNKSTVRTVTRIDFEVKDREIDIIFEGDGFLYNMVRIMAGTLIEVGTGDREPESVKEVFRTKDREKAGMTLPPQGLYLDEVFYE